MSSINRSGPAARRQESRTMKIKKASSKDQAFKRWPRSCANHKVQERDGSFLETLQSVAAQQYEAFSSDTAAISKDVHSDEPLPTDSQLGLQDTFQPKSGAQMDTLYVEGLYTIKHRIGTTSQSHLSQAADLYEYLQASFKVTPADHRRLLARANDVKAPIVVLDISVVEAKGLEAKDADGYSDPYCMLGIVPAKADLKSNSLHGGSNGLPVSRGSQRRKTPLEAIPARYIKTTTVKDNSLNPVWEEKFRFDLEDVITDKLHLDIWDHDDDTSVMDSAKKLNEVKGLKGLGRYFKQIAQSARTSSDQSQDDFLGCIDIPLVDIPSTGLDRWYDLCGRTSKSSVQGSVRLKLSLATYEERGRHGDSRGSHYDEQEEAEEEEGLFEMREHSDLMSAFIRYELDKAKISGEIWRGYFSKAATTILHQHAIQGDLTDLQQAVCHWMALEEQFCYKAFDWSILLKGLEELNSKWKSGSLYREEEEALSRSFQHFTQYCMTLIERQRHLLTLTDSTSHHRLTSMLTCVTRMYSTDCFKRCCPFTKDLKFEIIAALKKAVTKRYETLQERRKSVEFNDESTLAMGYAAMMESLVRDNLRALHLYTPAYQSLADFCYFQTYYKQSRRLLSLDLTRDLEVLTQLVSADAELSHVDFTSEAQQSSAILQLYLSLAQYKSLDKQLPSGCDSSNIGELEIGRLFLPHVRRWIGLIRLIVRNRVLAAVESDQKVEASEIDGNPQQSTSAIDVAYTFGQIAEFWLNLRWSEAGSSDEFVSEITKIICDAALQYADLIHDKLKHAGYYDEVGQFDITQQLCITINNIEQVRRALDPLPECLRLEEHGEVVGMVEGLDTPSNISTLYEQVSQTDAQIINKIKLVVDRVADRMRPDIKKLVSRLCWAPEKAQSIDVIDRLMNYLDSNLITLNSNLLGTNFERILESIWMELLEEITDVITTKDREHQNAHWISARLSESLEILVDFFHAGGKGLPMGAVHCPLYTEIYRQLKLNLMSANELITEFYVDRIKHQEDTVSSRHGTIYVRVYLKPEASLLMVEVLHAKNLLPMDANGLSDPYIVVQLCPQHIFIRESSAQTKVISRSLNPQFNDSFEFHVTEDQCLTRGACVQFTVMDHDVLTANDFAGEAYLPLSSVHGVSKRKKLGLTALTPLPLPLLNPVGGDEAGTASILSVMFQKTDQKDLTEFVKRRRNLYTAESD